MLILYQIRESVYSHYMVPSRHEQGIPSESLSVVQSEEEAMRKLLPNYAAYLCSFLPDFSIDQLLPAARLQVAMNLAKELVGKPMEYNPDLFGFNFSIAQAVVEAEDD